VTCLYIPAGSAALSDCLQSVGMMSDFYAGVLVDRQLEGMKFALGPTIATIRTRLNGFGGYLEFENRPADDLLVGRLIEQQGCEVVLLRYAIETICDYSSIRDLLHQRLRWIVAMRHIRPWGHLGLSLTQGLPCSLAAVAIHPSAAVAMSCLGRLHGFADSHDLDHRDTRSASAGSVEADASHSGLRCRGVRYVADQFQPQ
jgi:ceramide glucosyltransferase